MSRIFLTIFVFLSFSRVNAQDYDRLQKRIESISEKYLNSPYLHNPLGENSGYDSDPLYRFDGFDCVTYVETVLALSLSEKSTDFLALMNKIRYKDGNVSFAFRNHFTSIDWNINNQKNHILEDVTRDLFGSLTQVSVTQIDKSAWFKKFHQLDIKISPQVSELDFLPLETIVNSPSLLKRIPSGSIINIVTSGWLDISHQGFAILKNNVLYFRHASSKEKKVIEVPLYPYLKGRKGIKGINVLKL